METDILIIGSGIAGLTYALHLAQKRPNLKITIITKAEASESNTIRAQGGIAAVTDLMKDSIEKHVEDTINAGKGFSDPYVVRMVIANASERIKELSDWGVQFDKCKKGSLDLNLEGGHSESRVVHCKDFTGLEIENVLLERISEHKNIDILSYYFAVDLITDEEQKTDSSRHDITCLGAFVFDERNQMISPFMSRVTVLCTGGMGQVFERTTNPLVATGDGVAMAIRANVFVRDMHFVQFHPTAFFDESHEASFLISEAVRGFGAYLVDRNEKRFMCKYDNRAELATRDIISMAIENELSISGDTNVFLDCRHLDISLFREYFPTINTYCVSKGIDISKGLIPVAPAAHYQCGGISVNLQSETNIRHLFAIGECSSTGLHGANRLASNSLLEAIVFSYFAFIQTNNIIDGIYHNYAMNKLTSKIWKPDLDSVIILQLKSRIRSVMSKNAGISKSFISLQIANKSLLDNKKLIDFYLEKYKLTIPLLELRNINIVAMQILNHALKANSNVYSKMDMTKII